MNSLQNKCMNLKYLLTISGLVSVCILSSGCNNNGSVRYSSGDGYAADAIGDSENQYDEKTEIYSDKGELNWRWVIKPEDYRDCCLVSEDWFAVKGSDGKYRVVDEQEKEVFPEKYDEIAFFSEGLSAVREGEVSFFINKKGEKVSGEFQGTRSFHETYAAVKSGGLWGYINQKGEVVIDCRYMEAADFCEGFAAVKKDGKWGFIDQGGACLTGYEYEEVKNFQERFAAVRKDGKWGFIDQRGICLTGYEYEEAENFQEGFAAVMRNDKWGFLDSSGQIKIDLEYDGAGNFSEGKAAVKIENDQEYAGLWAYINPDNEIMIDFRPYDAVGGLMVYVGEFHDGKAFVSNDLYSIIDENGEYLFRGNSAFFISSLAYNTQYDAIPAYIYADDSMKVRKYGLVGLNGEQRLEPVFDYVHGIYGDYVLVSNEMDNGEWRYGFIKIWEE